MLKRIRPPASPTLFTLLPTPSICSKLRPDSSFQSSQVYVLQVCWWQSCPPPAPPRFISCEQIVFLQTLVSSIRHTLWLKLCIMSTLLIHRLWIIMTYYDYEWLWNSATFIQIGKCLKLKAQDDACQAATGLLPRWKKKEVTRVAPTMKHHATRTGWNKLKRKPRSHAGCSQLYGENWLEEPSLKHTLDSIYMKPFWKGERLQRFGDGWDSGENYTFQGAVRCRLSFTSECSRSACPETHGRGLLVF